jgi:hypothetical protein
VGNVRLRLLVYNNEATGWIHETHNCYLGTQREFLANGKYTVGYGAAAAMSMMQSNWNNKPSDEANSSPPGV